MGQIGDYTPMGAAPVANDMLFIADINGSPAKEIKSITVANLHRVANVAAEGVTGLSLKDDGGNYGIIINDGGNVGIGPGASPGTTSRLDVRGTTGDTTIAQFFNATATSDGDITQILVGTDRADYKSLALRYTYDTVNNDGLITLRHFEDATEGIHLKGDGNVGIGQTAPTSKLHIGNGVGSATPSLRVQGADTGTPATSYNVFLYTDATNGPGIKSGTANDLHLQKGYGGGSNTDLYCFYNTSDPVTPLMIQSSDGNVGIGTNSPSGTLEISSNVDNALFIYSRASAKNARIRLLTASGTNSYIQDVNTGAGLVAIGGTSTPAAGNCLQISKTESRISLGGTMGTFDYAITTHSNPATQAYFSNGNGTKSHIYITNSTSSVCSGAVVFGNETVTNKARWMCGQFWNTSHNYFGFEYLGGSSKTPETAAFNTGGLETTTVYISQDGGISAENTAAAFGTALGDPTATPAGIVGTGQYNVASAAIKTGYTAVTGTAQQSGTTVTAPSGTPFTAEMVGRTFDWTGGSGSAGHITSFTSTAIVVVSATVTVGTDEAFTIGAGNAITITFTKDLDAVGAGGPNYTIVASGYDGTNNQVMWGEATDRSAGSCDITFQTAGVPVPNLTETAVKWTWVIHGAKLKGS